MNKKHFTIFRDEKGSIVEMDTSDFAKKYPHYLNKTSEGKTMDTNRQLVLNHGFTLVANEEKAICYNLFKIIQ